MSIGWLAVSRQLLRPRGGYRPLVAAVALGFAIAVLSTALGERMVQHAHEMAALPADARIQVTASPEGRSARSDLAAIRSVPGVRAAAWFESPLRTTWERPELFDGPGGRFVGWVVTSGEGAFETLGLRLLPAPAPPPEHESAGIVPVFVSRSFLRELGAGAGPGTRLRSVERGSDLEVAGVVEDFLSHGDMRTSRNTVLWPAEPRESSVRTYLVRADQRDVDSALSGIGAALQAPGRYLRVEKTSEMLLATNQPMLRARAWLHVVQGIVLAALVLGLSAAAASRAVERRREFAVMRALGATRGDVIVAVLLESTVVTAMGLVIGAALVAALFGPLSKAIPFFALHPATVAARVALFFAIGWAASLVPALRAARVPAAVATA